MDFVSAYKAAQQLVTEGYGKKGALQVKISRWKKQGRIKTEGGLVSISEIRKLLQAKGIQPKITHLPKPKQKVKLLESKNDSIKKKATKKKPPKKQTKPKPEKPPKKIDVEIEDEQELEELFDEEDSDIVNRTEAIGNYSFQKLKGQAQKAKVDALRAKLQYNIDRNKYIDSDYVSHYINQTISSHNSRLLSVPERMADICIAISKANDNDKQARIKLLSKWQEEISSILEVEKKEIINYCKKKNINVKQIAKKKISKK